MPRAPTHQSRRTATSKTTRIRENELKNVNTRKNTTHPLKVEVEVEDEDEGEEEEELGTLARNVERGILLNKELYVFTITFKICDSTPKLQKIHRRLTTSDDDDDDE
mmetsp:Transcript_3590/g.11024  ORF Transcript_3590/g.11024 Transcript_3590/m.11024 type:complete len:107 (+) Transcript_3590:2095-2415(+)